MKGIYKRGRTYWIRYAGFDGLVVRESTGSSKFRNAEALFLKRKQTVREGKQPETARRSPYHTFRQLAVEYLKWAKIQKSFPSKKYIVARLVLSFGELRLRQFTTMLLEQHQAAMLKHRKPATVNRYVATLHHMFTKAVEWEMANDETLKRLRKVKLLKENNRRLRYLSNVECNELINASDRHLRPIVITALNTGMRKSEILNLAWSRVDLKHGFILLEDTKNGERREIPINRTLKEVLHGIPRRIGSDGENPHVFINPNTGGPYTEVKKSFASASRRAGIKDFRFHDMRHTFASHLVMAGVDITTVKELLGHKTIAMTLRYAHLAQSHKLKAVETLDKTLRDESTAQLLHNPAVFQVSK
ncbi:MAG: integrase [bacterium]|nr:MAG: integrase [bacterium]